MKVTTILKGLTLVGAVGAVAVGCDGDKSDPSTASKSDLNPPGMLWTVTKDSAVELRWTAGNVEEDFKGYYVFKMKKADWEKAGKPLPAKPTSAVEVTGVPRCQDNSKFFEAFGLPASTKSCDDDAEPAAAGGTTAGGTTAGAMLAEGDAGSGGTGAAGGDAAAEKLTGFVKCDEAGSVTEPSLPKAAPQTETQRCTLSGLTNGETYGFIVVAVAGDELNKVSWSSNLIWDTPSSDAVPEKEYTLENGKALAFEIDTTNKKVALSSDSPKACTGTKDACSRISEPNEMTAAKPTVFLGRSMGDALSYKQRLYISTPKGGAVALQPRGPQTYDPVTGAKTTRIPGDEAADAFPSVDGVKYVVYNNQVFDFEVTEGTNKWYGKLVVEDVKYAGTAETDSATLKLAVIMQPAAGVHHYFW